MARKPEEPSAPQGSQIMAGEVDAIPDPKPRTMTDDEYVKLAHAYARPGFPAHSVQPAVMAKALRAVGGEEGENDPPFEQMTTGELQRRIRAELQGAPSVERDEEHDDDE